MNQELEARYQEILGGFSPEERLRLPLDYAVYGESLTGIVSSITKQTSVMEPVSLAPIYEVTNELYENLARQIAAAEIRESQALEEGEAAILAEELALLSETSHRKLVGEYFFLINVAELMDVVRRGIEDFDGEGTLPQTAEIIDTVKKEVIRIFQMMDTHYERIQQLVKIS